MLQYSTTVDWDSSLIDVEFSTVAIIQDPEPPIVIGLAVGFGVYGTDYDSIKFLYPESQTIVSEIESMCGVGTPGIFNIEIAYSNIMNTVAEEISIDTTNSSTFWNDIKNWLYLNNFYDITYNSSSDQYISDDIVYPTYIVFNTIS